jgi:hypothetical protein
MMMIIITITIINRSVQIFQRPRNHLKILSAKKKWQEATSLLRRHRTKSSRQTDLAPGICAHVKNTTTQKSSPWIQRKSDTWRITIFQPLRPSAVRTTKLQKLKATVYLMLTVQRRSHFAGKLFRRQLRLKINGPYWYEERRLRIAMSSSKPNLHYI